MAPSIAQIVPSTAELTSIAENKIKYIYNQTIYITINISDENSVTKLLIAVKYKYSQYLLIYNRIIKFPPIEPFDFIN
jgi:hypothetical protein